MDTARFVRLAGGIAAIGALIQIGWCVVESLDPISDSAGFGPRAGVAVLSHLMLLVGVIDLARSRAIGDGWPARIGCAVAALGWGLLAAAQIQVRIGLGEQLFYFAEPFIGLGMVAAGIGAARAGWWRGWARWVPLVCGLYPFVVGFPAYALTGGPSPLAFGGWALCWLALAVALRRAPVAAPAPADRRGVTSPTP